MRDTADKFNNKGKDKSNSRVSDLDSSAMTNTKFTGDDFDPTSRSAIDDHLMKSRKLKRLWRKGFSEMYDITDMKPIHVVVFNVSFILKRFLLACVLVLYKPLSGNS